MRLRSVGLSVVHYLRIKFLLFKVIVHISCGSKIIINTHTFADFADNWSECDQGLHCPRRGKKTKQQHSKSKSE